MKKFWIVLGSLALVAAFVMPAAAVDVKFSGEFYVAGDYYNRITPAYNVVDDEGRTSTAFFRQRLRIQTEFAVSPGLSLITRFDALEKIWGDTAWNGTRGDSFGRPAGGPPVADGYDTIPTRVQENIEFEYAYIQYASGAPGIFFVGYIPWDFWGTTFGDSRRSSGGVMWVKPMGSWTIGALYVKNWEGSTTYKRPTLNRNDNDDNAYVGIVSYANDKIDAGMKVAYRRLANNSYLNPWDDNYDGRLPPGKVSGWLLTPYFKGQFGPVKVQGELEYFRGRINGNPGWEDQDSDIRALAGYVDAQVAIGPAYVGGLFAYASGVDAAKAGPGKKLTGSNFSRDLDLSWGGRDFKPTLILWNEDVYDWAGDVTWTGPGMKNAKLFQLYAGAAVKDFDFKVAIAHARAVEKNTIDGYMWRWGGSYRGQGSSYGWELDGTVTYKITNNLSYMVGAGYLWTGKFFEEKGYDDKAKNMYLFTNKLTLTF